jgi:hypothetical protein
MLNPKPTKAIDVWVQKWLLELDEPWMKTYHNTCSVDVFVSKSCKSAYTFFFQLHYGCSNTKSLNPPLVIKRRLMQKHEMAFQLELMNIK